ncbi:MAG: radical SAM protein [Alphaproteobacteria bacterium]
MASDLVVPKRLQTETIFGCNASCVMCAVDQPTTRHKGVMPLDFFRRIIDEMVPWRDLLEKTDLFGVGEPLLDKTIFDKIAYARARGMPSVAISTNADLLTEDRAGALLDAGIDVVIFSVDGVRPETHESIRVGVSFPRVVANIEAMVRLRDQRGAPTRFVFRFIRQDTNRTEWEAFHHHWSQVAGPADLVIRYDVQSWGGKVGCSTAVPLTPVPDAVPCHHLFDRLIVLRDGTVPLCCADVHQPELDLGNAHETPVMDIYNGPRFQAIRALHLAGRRREMRICRDCTILESEANQQVFTG